MNLYLLAISTCLLSVSLTSAFCQFDKDTIFTEHGTKQFYSSNQSIILAENIPLDSEVNSLVKLFESIWEYAGDASSGIRIHRTNELVYSYAMIGKKTGNRYILYNPYALEYVKQKSNTFWGIVQIMAHEYSHHAYYHTFNFVHDSKRKELDADFKSGFLLRLMNAPLEEALSAIQIFGDSIDTDTHPNRNKRTKRFSDGYKSAESIIYAAVIRDSIFISRPEVYTKERLPKQACSLAMSFESLDTVNVNYLDILDKIELDTISSINLPIDLKQFGHKVTFYDVSDSYYVDTLKNVTTKVKGSGWKRIGELILDESSFEYGKLIVDQDTLSIDNYGTIWAPLFLDNSYNVGRLSIIK